jgi:hypothetical protein
MRLTREHGRELLAGGVMTLAGLGIVLEARSLDIGTMARMGPGLYPMVLGVALSIVGALIAFAGQSPPEHEIEGFGRPDWRGWSCIILGVIGFIVAGEYLGLAPAAFVSVFVAAYGDRQATFRSSLTLAASATVVAAVVFSLVLKFQLPLLRW